jgi:hypothetical protein
VCEVKNRTFPTRADQWPEFNNGANLGIQISKGTLKRNRCHYPLIVWHFTWHLDLQCFAVFWLHSNVSRFILIFSLQIWFLITFIIPIRFKVTLQHSNEIENKLICHICQKKFVSVSTKNLHLKTMHNEKVEERKSQHIKCPICSEERKKLLANHDW